MKKLKFFYLLVLILFCASCAKDQLFDSPYQSRPNASPFNLISPQIKIAVVSDIHYLDPSLMPDDYVKNPDFQKKMSKDRKLIELSDPIFRKAVSELISEKPDILLITGDLASEGELISHETVKGFLQQLENEGIKVYVVPGNNDIYNPDAVSYKISPPEHVANIDTAEFALIYGNFGYNEAIYRDKNSLSYICQPCNGLWILGINACKYIETDGKYTVTPELDPATLAWIQEKMVEARKNKITVLAMMHYGIMEHYVGQYKLEGGLVNNYQEQANTLTNAGIKLIFTGHFHGNDITNFTNAGKTMTDIETGSLVTPLSPYRLMVLDDNFIKIETRRITDVDADLPGGLDFLSYSDSTVKSRLDILFRSVAKNWFGQSTEEAQIIAPFISRAWMAHFAGDEKIGPEERKNLEGIAEFTNPKLMGAINSIWTDLQPYSDNKIHIKLK